MEKPGLSATDVGRPHGLNGRVTNRLLEALGVLEGRPGDWTLTEKGAALASTIQHDNGYGGYAYRGWETTYYDPQIVDEITPELIEQARNADIAHRAQKTLENAASREEAEAAFQDFQRKQAAESAPSEINWGKVALLMLGAVAVISGVVVVRRYGSSLKEKWESSSAKQHLASAKHRILGTTPTGEGAPGAAADEEEND